MIVEIYGIMIMVVLAFMIGWNSNNIRNNNGPEPSTLSLIKFFMGQDDE